MKILVISQYYAPEPFRIADICEELVKTGHEVTVITGVPNYPEGEIYPGYEKGQHKDEVVNGVKIHRCFTIPRKTGAICRFLNYYSYAISASAYVRTLPNDYDVVFINQLSPVMMAYAGIAYSKKNNVPVVMYCLDLWPESLTAGGIARGSAVYRLFHRISKKIYSQMDTILLTSRCFSDYLQEQFGISSDSMEYLPQYAESLFQELPQSPEKNGWDFTFAGNIGEAQSVETILNAAVKLKDTDTKFHIVGGGSELTRMQDLAKELELDNVVFYGRLPLEEMPRFYAMSDAMLITLKKDPVLSLTLPGKVQSYMAAGKPIIGAIDGETAEVIKEAGCGFCGKAEDADVLAQNIRAFLSADGTTLGRNARSYYKKHFTKEQFIQHLTKALTHTETVQAECD